MKPVCLRGRAVASALLRCGASMLSLELLGAVGRLAPLDRILRQRSGQTATLTRGAGQVAPNGVKKQKIGK